MSASVGHDVPGGVDALGAIELERIADGVVVDLRVAGRHARAGMSDEPLDDVLGNIEKIVSGEPRHDGFLG